MNTMEVATTKIPLLLLSALCSYYSPCCALDMDNGRRVLVTGAGGHTGQHIFRKLLARPGYVPIGTVRSEASRQALLEGTAGIGAADGAPAIPPESEPVCDINGDDDSGLDELMQDCDAVMICTSAKPAPTGEINEETKRPKFR
ncbi:hypothetical protein ACHAXR_000920 [Thalassiosira sp. AJA248-18]